jgi:hypothetical protein
VCVKKNSGSAIVCKQGQRNAARRKIKTKVEKKRHQQHQLKKLATNQRNKKTSKQTN